MGSRGRFHHNQLLQPLDRRPPHLCTAHGALRRRVACRPLCLVQAHLAEDVTSLLARTLRRLENLVADPAQVVLFNLVHETAGASGAGEAASCQQKDGPTSTKKVRSLFLGGGECGMRPPASEGRGGKALPGAGALPRRSKTSSAGGRGGGPTCHY